ncbi:hypothetical protein G7061_09225 [Erysipelothrix sp. HDW6B]|uniref:hypothetical protein n=1 Tax=Erysipelothrix sp. HDW6B TaxID=2714929 RepID=UPI00140E1299|nr:hypothetical protein [Erysipelothrix sp. HDW6B]QIK86782.1 hypothetical protein G7061_09225 [Erysipelothrix sp. HDW6B]
MAEINEKMNHIIYRFTMLDGGKIRRYISFNELITLVEWLKKSNQTSKYIKINPFYVNGKIQRQIEFDDFMFYLEFREHLSEEELMKHWSNVLGTNFNDAQLSEQYRIKTSFPLCLEGDIAAFKEAIDKYMDYLVAEIPQLLHRAINYLNIAPDDCAFGNFCFEIQSK